jgi:SAM-dependent methyltransferase
MGAPRPPRAPAFALTIPGIGPILRAQATFLGVRPLRLEFDGRADVVPFGVADRDALGRLRTAEDVFAEVAVLPRRATAHATAGGLDRQSLESGLDQLVRLGGAVGTRSFRVVTRVLDERKYNRTMLREAVIRRVLALLPTWRAEPDDSAVELWFLQTAPMAYRVGIRVGHLGTRSGSGRAVEREGALRPAAAAAMVQLAELPREALLDPCCGTGTILEEARAVGWQVIGGDIDRAAVHAATANTRAPVAVLDARQLPLADDAVRAVATNLPFGSRYRVQGLPVAWYRRVLSEAIRVAPTVIVLAAPSKPYRQALGRLPVVLRARHDVVLLGKATTIWALERRDS